MKRSNLIIKINKMAVITALLTSMAIGIGSTAYANSTASTSPLSVSSNTENTGVAASTASKQPSVEQLRKLYIAILKLKDVKVLTRGENKTIVIPSSALFIPTSANLVPDQHHLLDTVVQLMNTYTTVNVEVAAFTDTMTSKKEALNFTTGQAQQVEAYLVRKGLNARLVFAKGYGEQEPVAKKNLPNSSYYNQRVEIRFRIYPPNRRVNP